MMRLLVLGLGKPMAPFIAARLTQLAAVPGLELLVCCPPGGLSAELEGRVVALTEFDRRRHWRAGGVSALRVLLLRPRACWRLWRALRGKALWERMRLAFRYHQLASGPRPDVAHVQWIAMAESMSWLKTLYGIPLVGSARGSQVTVYPDADPAYAQQIRRSLLAADAILAVSADIVRRCVALGAPSDRVWLSYNGVDLARFFPNPVSARDTRVFRMLAVGKLHTPKGCLWLLALLRSLRQAGIPATLDLVGEGPDQQALRYMAKRLGVAPYLQWSGALAREHIPERYRSADVFVSASVSEGLSNATLEAMACGLPLVVFDCEGMSELIIPGVNGFIVPYGDQEGLYQALERLYMDEALREAMRAHGLHLARSKFDARIWVRRTLSQYRAIVRRHRRETLLPASSAP